MGAPGDIEVRALGPDDVEGAVEALVRAFNEFAASVGQSPSFQTFSQARATLRTALARGEVWGAVRNGRKVVGVAVCYVRGDYVSIGPVAVHPLAQERGVGRMLMRRIADEYAGASCLALTQAGTNPHSFTLYRTQGFRVVYPEAGFSGHPERDVAPADVREATAGDVDAICRIDRELTCIDRSQDLEWLLGLGRTFVRDDGYVMTVRLADTIGIGPAAARSPESMRHLVAAALRDVPPGGIIARAPANGAAFDAFVEAGMVPLSLGNLMAAGAWPARTGEHLHPMFPEVL